MKKLIWMFALILLLPLAAAQQGHMKLLAVKQNGTAYKGSIADLYLELRPGSGRVFLDTFPLTKLDTQLSTRFAKDIACNYLDINCDNYDFIYTITADSSIIGGPSAGAAITTLTISMLKDIRISDKVAITGTINSGGIIGIVSGLKEKIDVAKEAGMQKVLIPYGTRTGSAGNSTVDLVQYGKDNGIEVIVVNDINEALEQFTGRSFASPAKEINVDAAYTSTMKALSRELCQRSNKLKERVLRRPAKDKEVLDSAINLTGRAAIEKGQGNHYSAASLCFSANAKFSYLLLLEKNYSRSRTIERINITREKIKEYDNFMDNKKITTITDLETYMTVKERLMEAIEYLDEAASTINQSSSSFYSLAYGNERLNSAYYWSVFLDHRGKEFVLDKEMLRKSCLNKLSEFEERKQYLKLYLPLDIKSSEKEIETAYHDLENGDYALCLFRATKAKANLNLILNLIGVEEDSIPEIMSQKQKIAKLNIASQTAKGNFPVLGYSYYQYALSLADSDPYSSLLYTEYALDLSNIDMYFKEKQRIYSHYIDKKLTIIILASLFTGILIGFFIGVIIKTRQNT